MCIQGVLERFCRPSPYVSIILDNKSMVGIEKQRNTHTHTMGYHLPFGRISMIKKKKRQVLRRMWSKGNPSALLVGVYIGTATMEVPKKIKTKTSILFSKPTSDIYPKEVNPISKSYLHVHAHCSIIHNSWDMKAI